jgi:ribosome-associated protein
MRCFPVPATVFRCAIWHLCLTLPKIELSYHFNMTTFNLAGKEFIELNKLLKALSLVGSGGEAKMRIREEGEATVNGEVETQVRKKLRAGDRVAFGGEVISIVD